MDHKARRCKIWEARARVRILSHLGLYSQIFRFQREGYFWIQCVLQCAYVTTVDTKWISYRCGIYMWGVKDIPFEGEFMSALFSGVIKYGACRLLCFNDYIFQNLFKKKFHFQSLNQSVNNSATHLSLPPEIIY